MTTPGHNHPNSDDGDGDPGVGVWFEDHDDGSQTVVVIGERPDGQRFFGSFFQPTLNHDNDSEGDTR